MRERRFLSKSYPELCWFHQQQGLRKYSLPGGFRFTEASFLPEQVPDMRSAPVGGLSKCF